MTFFSFFRLGFIYKRKNGLLYNDVLLHRVIVSRDTLNNVA